MERKNLNKPLKDPYIKSQGLKKLWNYFTNIIETDEFQREIKDIRKKYNISIKKDIKSHQLPKQFMIDLENLSSKFGLAFSTWWTSLEPYVLNNKLIEPLDTDICIISDNINDPDLSKEDIKYYPISIRISPYASKRDILDYIKRFYPFISRYQEDYKNKKIEIGKFKSRRNKERDNFIYENRHFSRKEIMRLVGDKFGENEVIDYGYIGKIISLENKRRKKV